MFPLSHSSVPVEPATNCSTERTTGMSTHDGLIERVTYGIAEGHRFLDGLYAKLELKYARSMPESMISLFFDANLRHD